MEEIWKDIEGYEGLYQVSSLGRVKSLNYNKTGKEVILQQDHKYGDENNYCRIVLKQKHYSVHTLVAFAFPEICGEWFEGAVVNHKNEIKTDNRAENLEWCTQKHNCNYGTRSEKMSISKQKPIIAYNEHEEIRFDSVNEAAKYFSCNPSNITMVLRGYKYRHTIHGYKIKRAG